jgi:hypothetical protein
VEKLASPIDRDELTEMCLTASKRKPYAPVSFRIQLPHLLDISNGTQHARDSQELFGNFRVIVVDCSSVRAL